MPAWSPVQPPCRRSARIVAAAHLLRLAPASPARGIVSGRHQMELAKIGERSSETRLSEAADQAARHFLLRRRHLLVRDRVNIRDAEVFLCSEHLLWIEADE